MPFCPSCGYEYVKGITKCPDCQVPLVTQLSPDKESLEPETEWVPLHDLPSIVYAEMVKEAIEKAGIACFIKSDFITGAYGVKSATTVGSKCCIFVPKEFEKQSAEILDQMLNHI